MSSAAPGEPGDPDSRLHDDDATAIRPAVVVPEPSTAETEPVVSSEADAPSGSAAASSPRRRRGGSRWVLPLVGALVVVVVLLYAAAYLVAGDTLPRQAVVSGVDVGGLSPAAARERLTTELEPRVTEELAVAAGGRTAQVRPVDAGLAVDYAGSVEAAGGGWSFDPRQIVRVLTGGSATKASVLVDEEALSSAIDGVAATVDRKPVDAGLARDGDRFQTTKARNGVQLQREQAADALVAGFLTADGPLALPAGEASPEVTTEEADEVRKGFAATALSGPVRVSAGDAGSFRLTPAMIAAGLTFEARDGKLAHGIDADRLRTAALPALKTVELSKPRDATIRLVGGRPKVIPAVDGTSVSAEALAAAVEPVLTKRGAERRATVELGGAKAKVTTAEVTALGVKEVTGEFTTRFPYAEYRNVNIGRAAELINGTLLQPGETFSLNKVVGERTRANGFTEGFIISGGKFKRELGGGVSQSATTTYNAMFFAGLKDVEHQPHTLYIDRYPPGREATVAWPDLDLKFTNDTKYGVLVQADVVKANGARQGSITVKMWSTKTYDKVTSTTPAKSNFTSGRDLEDSSASCEPQAPAQGFDVSYSRLFYRDGEVVRRQNFSWRYGPTDRIRCT